tara:strand:- start:2820 stop:3035 length:216 start_codon:yes stop_codon:yes gene_type:complete
MINLALPDLQILTDKIGAESERLASRLDWDYYKIAKFLIKRYEKYDIDLADYDELLREYSYTQRFRRGRSN